jgi:hypothetical protein
MTDWYKIKRILVGTQQVYPAGWKPWANTIAYYPLQSDANDYSWNGRNLTNSWITFSDWVGVFNGSSQGYYTNQSLFNKSQPFTYSVWVNPTSIPSWNSSDWPYASNLVMIYQSGDKSTHDKMLWLCDSNKWYWYNYYNWRCEAYASWVQTNTWNHLVFVFDWTTNTVYLNWAAWTPVACWGSYTWYSSATLLIWDSQDTSATQLKKFYWKLSNVIIESTSWTAQEVSAYYNWTKWNYGL